MNAQDPTIDGEAPEDLANENNIPRHPGARPGEDASAEVLDTWQQENDAWAVWRLRQLEARLTWTASNTPIPNVANVEAFLTWHPDWNGCFAFDQFAGKVMLKRTLSSEGGPGEIIPGRPLEDHDVTAVQVHLQRAAIPRIGKENVHDAIMLVAKANGYDPLSDHKIECRDRWDGKKRLDAFFSDYFVAKDVSLYTRALGPIVMMTLVLRAMRSGAFQKAVPILEGDQDIGKSTGLATLCPRPEWFGDALPPLNNKDVSTYLAGKFLIEIAELAATKRADIDDLKSFISRSVEKYRPPYGRQDVEQPRRCMFWGTTNRQDYLRDETGSCRFYPVVLASVDVEAIKRDRDQLLGEAVTRLEEAEVAGCDWWSLPEDAASLLAELRSSRGEDHPWTAQVLEFIEGQSEVAIPAILGEEHRAVPASAKGRKDENGRSRTLRLTKKVGLNIPRERRSRKESLAVAGILKAHGWDRSDKFTKGRWRGQARYVPKMS